MSFPHHTFMLPPCSYRLQEKENTEFGSSLMSEPTVYTRYYENQSSDAEFETRSYADKYTE